MTLHITTSILYQKIYIENTQRELQSKYWYNGDRYCPLKMEIGSREICTVCLSVCLFLLYSEQAALKQMFYNKYLFSSVVMQKMKIQTTFH